jgi:hypothetical protein
MKMRQTNDTVISHNITEDQIVKNEMFCPLEKINITLVFMPCNSGINSERVNVNT